MSASHSDSRGRAPRDGSLPPTPWYRDPFIVAFGVGLAALLSIDRIWGESLSIATREALGDAPFLSLAALAALRSARRARRKSERSFWWLWVGALTCWVAVSLMWWAVPEERALDRLVGLSSDLLFVTFYVLIALSAELTPHREEDRVAQAARRARSASAVVFVLGLLVYFVAIPWTFEIHSYSTSIPSHLLYVVLDVYLVVRFLRARHVCGDRTWRGAYTWCTLVSIAWVACDGWDLLSFLEVVPVIPLPWAELLGLPALLFVLFAARTTRGFSVPATGANQEHLPPERGSGAILAYAVAFPALHFALHAGSVHDPLDPTLENLREIWIVAILSQLAFLSWTYQRKIQDQVLKLENERRVLDRHIELTQRLDAVGRLAGGVAHDFNNSLQLIGTHADLLLREKLPTDPEREHVAAIRRAVMRAGGLTDELLTMSRKRQVQPTVFDLNEVPRTLAPLARKVAGDSIALTVDITEEPLWVRADREQLEHATLNLLLNARDALPKGGSIRVSTFREKSGSDGNCVLTVSDTGIGMNEEVRLRAFEPFFTTKGDDGTGLGLSMVYGIITQCGGTVDVTTKPGSGSRFDLRLPASEAPALPDESGEPIVEILPPGPKESVLVVEDELPILSVIRMHLRSSGYQVRTAADGTSALELFDEQPADVVITDVAMPGMTGLELHAMIEKRRPGTPVIFMSGYADSILDGASDSAQDVPLLHKPFTTDELDACIRRVLEHRQRAMTEL